MQGMPDALNLKKTFFTKILSKAYSWSNYQGWNKQLDAKNEFQTIVSDD